MCTCILNTRHNIHITNSLQNKTIYTTIYTQFTTTTDITQRLRTSSRRSAMVLAGLKTFWLADKLNLTISVHS